MEMLNKDSSYKLTYVCSPLSMGDFKENIENAKRYCRLFVKQGFNPIAPHIYYTSFLDDFNKEEREIGIRLGLQLLSLCDSLFVILNQGISKGMYNEIIQFNQNPIQRDLCFIYFKDKTTLEYDFILVKTDNNKSVTEVIENLNLCRYLIRDSLPPEIRDYTYN